MGDGDAPDKKILKKVSIVAVGGLGKTTLAKAVYDNFKLRYDCAAFVSIGWDHDLVKVFKDILFNLDKNRYSNIHNCGRGVDLLISEVREFLENKRYFLVVDDVWEVQTWKRIKLVFAENNCRSKVITTTRKFDVAEEAGEVYVLNPLSNNDSMKLFYIRIFGADPKYLDIQTDDICNKILMKCGGIPLAIITMSSLLVGKPKNEWSEIYNSIGFGSKGNLEVEETMRIISFSYYDLPPHLRTCLLYLITFPEDYEIDKDCLIWKWIAEGFINGDQGERLFELGERYFYDLINRSMIQVEGVLYGMVSCRVHDIVLDLLRKFSFEENFIAILDGNAEAISPPRNVRRFALHNRTAEHMSSEGKSFEMPNLRSYAMFGCDINNNWLHIPSFRILRVLDISRCTISVLDVTHLGDLLHLRYLGIRCQAIIPKPSKQITNLKLLQTLVLHGSEVTPDTCSAWFQTLVLPTQLLCLVATSVPDGIGKLTSLEQLNISAVDPKMLAKELGSLLELRVLCIINTHDMVKSVQRDFVGSLSNLQKIQKIDMVSMGQINADTTMWEAAGFVLPRSLRQAMPHWNMGIDFSKMPSCINPSSLPNLSYLNLLVDTMDEQDMKHLARLPALRCLYLYLNSTIRASIINAGGNDGCFQKLRHFRINAMVQLQQHNKEDSCISLHIWNSEGTLPLGSGKSNCSKNVPSAVMPNLEVLDFEVPLQALKDNNGDCTNIGLEYLPSLRQVMMRIDCEGVSTEEVDAVLIALRHACMVHPNHLTFNISKFNEDFRLPSDYAEMLHRIRQKH